MQNNETFWRLFMAKLVQQGKPREQRQPNRTIPCRDMEEVRVAEFAIVYCYYLGGVTLCEPRQEFLLLRSTSKSTSILL